MGESSEIIIQVVVTLVCMVLSLAVHEWAHAFAATKLGDPTAEREGRLTLSPIAHIDPLGTLLFPAIGAALGGVLFGWAKPVPFRPQLFKRSVTMRKGILLVAAAGPLSNLVLALLCAVGLRLLVEFGGAGLQEPGTLPYAGMLILQFAVRINVVLFLFNFLPIPPLDGHKVLFGLLGGDHPVVQFVERYQFVLFIVVLLLAAQVLGPPMSVVHRAIFGLVGLT